jgi:ArsR family transcriptional regulator, arsenate/arsenite/antimonite-responsive transcriptional repressor
MGAVPSSGLAVEPDIDGCQCLDLAQDMDGCQYRWVSNSRELPLVQVLACCPPLSEEPMSEAQAEQIAPLLKALADPVRLRLMSLVLSHEDGEACVCDLTPAFDLSQPTISHHLKVLHEAGLLNREKRGVWVYYQARPEAMHALMGLFDTVGTTAPAGAC